MVGSCFSTFLPQVSSSLAEETANAPRPLLVLASQPYEALETLRETFNCVSIISGSGAFQERSVHDLVLSLQNVAEQACRTVRGAPSAVCLVGWRAVDLWVVLCDLFENCSSSILSLLEAGERQQFANLVGGSSATQCQQQIQQSSGANITTSTSFLTVRASLLGEPLFFQTPPQQLRFLIILDTAEFSAGLVPAGLLRCVETHCWTRAPRLENEFTAFLRDECEDESEQASFRHAIEDVAVGKLLRLGEGGVEEKVLGPAMGLTDRTTALHFLLQQEHMRETFRDLSGVLANVGGKITESTCKIRRCVGCPEQLSLAHLLRPEYAPPAGFWSVSTSDNLALFFGGQANFENPKKTAETHVEERARQTHAAEERPRLVVGGRYLEQATVLIPSTMSRADFLKCLKGGVQRECQTIVVPLFAKSCPVRDPNVYQQRRSWVEENDGSAGWTEGAGGHVAARALDVQHCLLGRKRADKNFCPVVSKQFHTINYFHARYHVQAHIHSDVVFVGVRNTCQQHCPSCSPV